VPKQVADLSVNTVGLSTVSGSHPMNDHVSTVFYLYSVTVRALVVAKPSRISTPRNAVTCLGAGTLGMDYRNLGQAQDGMTHSV